MNDFQLAWKNESLFNLYIAYFKILDNMETNKLDLS